MLYVLHYYSLSSLRPVCLVRRLISWGDPAVAGTGPEPSVGVDGLEVFGVASLALEVALATGSPHGGHVVLLHDGGHQPVLVVRVEADQVHAPVAAEVAAVEPVPVLKLVPWLPPRQKVVVVVPFHVRNSCKEAKKKYLKYSWSWEI